MEAGAERAPRAVPRQLERLPSWLAGEVARHAHRLVSDALAANGLRKQHFATLTALAEEDGISQAALGRRLWIDRSDLHAIVAELEREGLIARVRDEHDRRRNVVKLTAAGRKATAKLTAQVEDAQAALLAPLSASERRELRRLLGRLVAHHSGASRS